MLCLPHKVCKIFNVLQHVHGSLHSCKMATLIMCPMKYQIPMLCNRILKTGHYFSREPRKSERLDDVGKLRHRFGRFVETCLIRVYGAWETVREPVE